MLDLASRRAVCSDTLARCAAITTTTPGASLTSTFHASQLPPLTKSHPLYPDHPPAPISIHNSDAFALARTLTPTAGRIGVLNLASDELPGGGWRLSLSRTQEEALCYSSSLFATLRPEWYPWPNSGPGSCAGVFSPGVVVFKDTLDRDCVDLAVRERHVLAVMTVAAPRGPRVTADGEGFADEGELWELREKVLLVLRLAGTNGVTKLVLGAMGCGAYGCPPRAVAQEMKSALEREEFEGWFETVVFAVYAAGPSGQRNLDVFEEVFRET
jgi:uncharacterized protein (TIGR02452 family)